MTIRLPDQHPRPPADAAPAAPDPAPGIVTPPATPRGTLLARMTERLAAVPQPDALWLRALVAVAIVLVATVISRLFDDFSDAPAYITMTIGVILASWFTGFRGGLLATVLAVLSLAFVIIEPRYRYPLGTDDLVSLAVFAVAALMAGAMYDVVHLTLDRSLRLATDREQLLHAVATSEERWRSLTEAMPALVSSVERDGRISYVNRTFVDYTGISAAAIAARPRDLIHAADAAAVAAAWETAMRTGASFSMEWRVRRHDGAWRWFSGTAVPLHRHDGAVSGWICSAVDIDDRRRAEEALAESRRQLSHRLAEMEALFQTAPVGIAIADDPACLYIHANAEFDRMLRVPTPDANVSATAPPGEAPDWYRAQQGGIDVAPDDLPMQRAARLDTPVLGEQLDIVFNDGAVISIFGGAIPLHDEAGAVRGVISAWIDVTERERYRRDQRLLVNLGAALNAAREYDDAMHAAVTTVAPSFADWCAIYVTEEDGHIERYAAGSIYGDALDRRSYAAAVETPSWVRRVLGGADQRAYTDVPDDVAAAIAPATGADRVLHVPPGSGIIAPVRTPGGITGAIAFGMLGERRFSASDEHLAGEVARRCRLAIENARLYRDARALLVQLRAANAAKDEFLGMVSHELKTPITTIMGNAEVLRKRANLIDEASRNEALEDIRADAERLNRIIGNLLMLARVDRNAPAEWEPVLLPRLVERVVREHRQSHPGRTIRVDTGRAGADGTVVGVAGYLDQVVQNLLSNAEKYSPAGEPIDIRIGRDDGSVDVRILDRGPGIPEGEADRLFTAFYRAPSTAATAKGVGIGLAVCKRLIEAEGGDIWAAPRAGGGSEFGFRLPAAEDA